MRIGHNPNRSLLAPVVLENIVLQVITHLPNLSGYHSQRLEVVKTCLTTMIQGIRNPYSLIICDNNSVPELIDWIKEEIKPTMLINSQNVGKTAQRKLMASMIPPDSVVCYSDDDMLFYDNWLQPQLDLLFGFPNVSCVSGYPVRTSFRWGNTNTKEWAQKHAMLESGKYIPDEWERDFSISIGRDVNAHKQGTEKDLDYLIKYKELKAYATSHHCQQIGYAGTLAKALEYDGLLMGSERGFDEKLDKMGLRLATTKRLTRHMGNVFDDELKETVNGLVRNTNGGINVTRN